MAVDGDGSAFLGVCDPLLVMSLVIADEEVYEKSGTPLRLSYMDEALPLCTLASFVFDQLISPPVSIAGLDELLGAKRSEDFFAPSMSKLVKSGFLSVEMERHIPDDKKEKFARVATFLKNVHTASVRADLLASQHPGLEPAYEMWAYSRFANLPFVSTVSAVETPAAPDSASTSTRQQFEMLGEVLEIELPELAVESLDDILEIRAKEGAREFRRFFNTFYRSMRAKYEGSPQHLSAEVVREWNRVKNEGVDLLAKEFKDSVSAWQTIKAGASVVLDLVGLIPFVSTVTGLIGLGKDSAELVGQVARRGRANDVAWIAFLADLRRRPSTGNRKA
jgi:hypothetical protein